MRLLRIASKNKVTAVKAANFKSPRADNTIYSIDGRKLGSSFASLPRGIYIMGGKKIVKAQ